MKKTINRIFASIILIVFSASSFAQEYTFEDFVGTWHGTILSPSTYGNTVPITMTIEPDGFYTETSGYLMPSLYPDTQECEYEASSNRMHWWYLGTAWGGQYFYDHFFYEIVHFENGVLEMHYNFWDDPEPHPEVGTIYLIKEGATVMPPPAALAYQWMDNSIMLSWNEPDPGTGQLAELTGYNIYHQNESSDFELLGFTESTSFNHSAMFQAGLHTYYISAIYEEGESEPSDNINIVFLTPSPESLEGMFMNNNVELTWNAPESGSSPVATLSGYNVYHQTPGGSYQLHNFTNEMMLIHTDSFAAGLHTWYVTAVYEGGESGTSNMVSIDFLTPPPLSLEGILMDNTVELTWSEPRPGNDAMAALEGYNIYHMPENGSWEMLAYTETNNYSHENLQSAGVHTYYVTAVYNGGVSEESNYIEILNPTTGISDDTEISTTIYPNPAKDFINISSEFSFNMVKILNQSGQILRSLNVKTNNIKINLNDIPSGLYILLLETTEGPVAQRIIIK